MLWVLYSLLSAFSLSTADTLSKKGLERADEYSIAWIRLLFSLPYFLLALLFIEIPKIDKTFWISIIILLPLEIAATILYIKAIKVSPLSLTIPFLSFTPLFLIITSLIILGETPSIPGIIGIILIVTGAYTLNIHELKKPQGLLEPLRAIMKERGSVYMIIVAFIYSVTANFGKLAIVNSSPVFFGIVYYLILTAAFTPIALTKSQGRLNIKGNIFIYFSIGLFIALMVIFHVFAIVLTDVAYMIAIKRTNLVFSVIYGHLIFREGRIGERLLSSAIMVAGVAIISFLG
ncbi:MAG: DMT family transporter [Nitrospirae bacterium]|nr:DMT family transporter [Nitrospirota bacterium]